MKLPIATAALVFITIPVIAQDARTGVSTPPPAEITVTGDDSPALKPRVPDAKPSAAVPDSSSKQVVYGSYVPYRAPAQTSTAAFDPDANIVTETVPDTP